MASLPVPQHNPCTWLQRVELTAGPARIIHPPLDQPSVRESPVKRRYDNQISYPAASQSELGMVGGSICMEG
jgi:hypothetical protein